MTSDTIVSPVTPHGRGAVSIIRISGPDVLSIATSCFKKMPQHRIVSHSSFFGSSGEPIDDGLLIFFKAPHSFTGEDVLEFQGHGSPVLMKLILDHLLTFPNTRLSRAGEFSERAFLHGKIDLTQAEAIADLVASESEKEASAALSSLRGRLSEILKEFEKRLLLLRTRIEASLDFLEDELSEEEECLLQEKIADLKKDLIALVEEARQSHTVRSRWKIALLGPPNAGKSSLFNLLIKKERAIVTPVAGTTRDFIEENVNIGQENFCIIDTAGLHESEEYLERLGMERTLSVLKGIDLAFWVQDASVPQTPLNPWIEGALAVLQQSNVPILGIWNKMDLRQTPILPAIDSPESRYARHWFPISCKNCAGLEELQNAVLQFQGVKTSGHRFLARKRHLLSLEKALDHFPAALSYNAAEISASPTWDQIAEALLQVQHCLAEITGKNYTQELLTAIFSTFCLGK